MQKQGFLEYVSSKWLLIGLFFLCVFLSSQTVYAGSIVQYSDRLSDSGPNAESNHTINFKTLTEILPGGTIRFTPSPNDFDIPATDFDIDNIALYVASTASSSYLLRSATGTPSASEDGISITSGTSGNIEITLNSVDSIPANALVRLLIGKHTPNATTTDSAIVNPSGTGTFVYYIRTDSGVANTEARGMYAIVDKVTVGDVDTRETNPPVRFNGAPSTNISGLSTFVQFSLETDEFSKCRYSTASGTPFFSMGNEITSAFTIVHAKLVAVTASTTYSFFIRCIDDEGNVNIDDYLITFSVLALPTGTPTNSGTTTTGSGSSTSNTGSQPGGGGSGGGGSSGGGSGGGSGAGDGPSNGGFPGGEGFEGTTGAYQSGDGLLIINGYAFPRSKIVVLVDGTIAKNVTSDSSGSFSVTIDAIARGAYTFGVYGIDKNGVKSSTFATTFTITGSRGSTLSNINVMPSIKVSPNPVNPDSTLTISGYAIPDATITIENQNDKSSASLKSFTTTSDGNGLWTIDISTQGFNNGTYKVRAKAKQEGGASTNYSGYTFYGVGEAAKLPTSADLNRDGKVNLIDFSILLFWWNTPGGASNPPADINSDGKVSLTDFSIMIFNWTG